MKKLLEYKFELLLSLLILSFPFSTAIPNILLLITIFICCIEYKKININELVFSTKILIVLLLFLILKSILFGFIIEELSYYLFYLIIICFPILFLRLKNIKILKNATLVSINISIVVSIFKIVVYYYYYKHLPFNDGWAVNQILVLERPYAGLFSLIAMVLSIDLYKNSSRFKFIYTLSFLISILFIFLISARISILSLVIVLLVYLFFYFKSLVQYKVLIVFGVLTLFVSALFLNTNLSRRFFLNKNLTTSYQIAKSSEPRVIIWNCAIEISKSEDFNKLIGISSFNIIKAKLTNCYSNSIDDSVSKRKWFTTSQFNTHNQFLHVYLLGGFISLILFILFIFYSFYIIKNNFFGLSIIIILTLILLVENVFQRQFGVYAFIISYCLYLPKKINKKLV